MSDVTDWQLMTGGVSGEDGEVGGIFSPSAAEVDSAVLALDRDIKAALQASPILATKPSLVQWNLKFMPEWFTWFQGGGPRMSPEKLDKFVSDFAAYRKAFLAEGGKTDALVPGSPMAIVKAHPVVTGAVVVGVGFALWRIFR